MDRGIAGRTDLWRSLVKVDLEAVGFHRVGAAIGDFVIFHGSTLFLAGSPPIYLPSLNAYYGLGVFLSRGRSRTPSVSVGGCSIFQHVVFGVSVPFYLGTL